ncbi:hypothetical protein PVAND_012709 [Polypedilum vanderplanki]|uniref:Uncharacterized protein n=1 Tax=Polypedilum vanderplanki TaxID=319348 RepID=A0A9J6CND1_POLVA|nr:hypothetical protein PVAND_012709 [Polypedilum vanderplanki]
MINISQTLLNSFKDEYREQYKDNRKKKLNFLLQRQKKKQEGRMSQEREESNVCNQSINIDVQEQNVEITTPIHEFHDTSNQNKTQEEYDKTKDHTQVQAEEEIDVISKKQSVLFECGRMVKKYLDMKAKLDEQKMDESLVYQPLNDTIEQLD